MKSTGRGQGNLCLADLFDPALCFAAATAAKMSDPALQANAIESLVFAVGVKADTKKFALVATSVPDRSVIGAKDVDFGSVSCSCRVMSSPCRGRNFGFDPSSGHQRSRGQI